MFRTVLICFLGSLLALASTKDLVDMEFCGEEDCYEILNVTTDATRGEVRRGYHQMSLKYHPDKLGAISEEEKAEANAMFIKASTAYEILSDEKKRQSYDVWVRGGRKRRPNPEDFDGPMPAYYRDDSVRDVQDTPAAFAAVAITLLISVGVPLCLQFQSRIRKTFRAVTAFVRKITGTPEARKRSEGAEGEGEEKLSRRERRGEYVPKPTVTRETADIQAVPTTVAAASNGDSNGGSVSSWTGKRASGPWTEEEDAELARAMAKLPGGTSDRWAKIAELVGTRNEQDCAARANQIKSGTGKGGKGEKRGEDAAGGVAPTKKAKSELAKLPVAEFARRVKEAQSEAADKKDGGGGKEGGKEAVGGGGKEKEKGWTQAEQTLLENAMRVVDKKAEDRWEQIAAMVPSRSKKEVVARVKELKEMVRKQQE